MMNRSVGLVLGSLVSLIVLPSVRAQSQISVTEYKFVVTRLETDKSGQKTQDTFSKITYVAPDGRTLDKFQDPSGSEMESIYDPHSKIAIRLDMTHKTALRMTGMGEDYASSAPQGTYLGTKIIQGEVCKGYKSSMKGVTVEAWPFDDPDSGAGLNARFITWLPNGNKWSENLAGVTKNVLVPDNSFNIPTGFSVTEKAETH